MFKIKLRKICIFWDCCMCDYCQTKRHWFLCQFFQCSCLARWCGCCTGSGWFRVYSRGSATPHSTPSSTRSIHWRLIDIQFFERLIDIQLIEIWFIDIWFADIWFIDNWLIKSLYMIDFKFDWLTSDWLIDIWLIAHLIDWYLSNWHLIVWQFIDLKLIGWKFID